MPQTNLNYQERALLFRRLANMEHAGIDMQTALSSLGADKEKNLASKCRLTSNKIKHGKPFHQAAHESGLIDTLEAQLIKTSQQQGSPETTYTTLANNYEHKARQLRQLKSKLMLPLGILLLAGFIGPLPQLVTGKLSALDYVLKGMGFALLVLAVMLLLLKLPLWIRQASLADKPIAAVINQLMLSIPLIKQWTIRRAVCQWLELSGLLLGSGLSAFDTMPLVNNTLTNKHIKQSFESAEAALHEGQSFTQAFSHHPYLSDESKHFINSGEAAGRLPEMLKHSATLENERLQALEQQLSEWLPRLIYFLVLLWLASSITGQGVTPHLDAIP